MLAAAKMIVASNDTAKKHHGLATTGILTGHPGSVNTMAHTVSFTLDIRHTSDEEISKIEHDCKKNFAHIAEAESERGCTVSWKQLVDSPAVHFHPACISAIEESAKAVSQGLAVKAVDRKAWRYMISGAGHDSCYTNRRCPTAMIFTTTLDGISHNPKEYCAPEDWSVY